MTENMVSEGFDISYLTLSSLVSVKIATIVIQQPLELPSVELIFSLLPESPAACDQQGLYKWKLEKEKDRASVILRGVVGERGQIWEVKDEQNRKNSGLSVIL